MADLEELQAMEAEGTGGGGAEGTEGDDGRDDGGKGSVGGVEGSSEGDVVAGSVEGGAEGRAAEGGATRWVELDESDVSDFHTQLPSLRVDYPFELDDFQKRAGENGSVTDVTSTTSKSGPVKMALPPVDSRRSGPMLASLRTGLTPPRV